MEKFVTFYLGRNHNCSVPSTSWNAMYVVYSVLGADFLASTSILPGFLD